MRRAGLQLVAAARARRRDRSTCCCSRPNGRSGRARGFRASQSCVMIFRPYADPRRRETGRKRGLRDRQDEMDCAGLAAPLAARPGHGAGVRVHLDRDALDLCPGRQGPVDRDLRDRAPGARCPGGEKRRAGRLSYVAGQETIEILDAATVKADGRRHSRRARPDPRYRAASAARRGDVQRHAHQERRLSRRGRGRHHSIRLSPEALLHELARLLLDRADQALARVKDVGDDDRRSASAAASRRASRRRVPHGRVVGERVRHDLFLVNDKAIPHEPGSTSDYDWSDRFSVSTFKSYAEIGDTTAGCMRRRRR